MPTTCPNDSGLCVTEGCEAYESSLWYGKKGYKKCKHCYDTESKESKKRKLNSGEQAAATVEQAGDTLVKIIEICGARYAASALDPNPRACPDPSAFAHD